MADLGRGKRRRTIVSYAEENEELDILLSAFDSNNEESPKEVLSEVEDVDCTYGEIDIKLKNKRRRTTLSMAKPKKTRPTFPFLQLPPELRDEIYRYWLTDSTVDLTHRVKRQRRVVRRDMCPVRVCDPCSSSPDMSTSEREQNTPHTQVAVVHRNPFSPAILATCKQIHGEAVGLLYGQRLHLQDSRALHVFLAGIGPDNCKLIREISIGKCGGYMEQNRTMIYPAFTLLTTCTSIKSIRFNCMVVSQPAATKYKAANIVYRDCYEFIRAYAEAKVSVEAALDIIHLSPCNFDPYYHGSYWSRGSGRCKLSEEELAEREEVYKSHLMDLASSILNGRDRNH